MNSKNKKLLNVIEDLTKKDVYLQHVKQSFSESDLKMPHYNYMHKLYDKELDLPEDQNLKLTRVINSIIAAAINQRRKFFSSSRRGINDIIKSDVNWNNRVVLHPRDYKKLIKLLHTDPEACGLRIVKHGDRGSATVFEVIDPDALSYIQVDVEKQKEESLQFQKNFHDKEKIRETKPDKAIVSIPKKEPEIDEGADTDAAIQQAIEESRTATNKPTSRKLADGTYVADLGIAYRPSSEVE